LKPCDSLLPCCNPGALQAAGAPMSQRPISDARKALNQPTAWLYDAGCGVNPRSDIAPANIACSKAWVQPNCVV